MNLNRRKSYLLVGWFLLLVGSLNFSAMAEEEATLHLESTLVGDKEQPTVSYFIPWKGTGTPDQLHWNLQQKNDKTLDLVDRQILIRSKAIYKELDMEN